MNTTRTGNRTGKFDLGVTFEPNPENRKHGVRKSIETIQAETRKGLWGLVFFLAASIISWNLTDQVTAGPMLPGMVQIIEPSTFLALIDIVLAVSTISDMILIAGRLNDGTKPARVWLHVGFRTVFFLFYLIGGLLPLRFFAVFCAGVLVIGFEQVVLYCYAHRTIREEKELLSALGR